MQLTHSVMFLILAALLNARIAAAEQNVLTSIRCKENDGMEELWGDIGIYDRNEKLFIMDCQTTRCTGSGGHRGKDMYVCGYKKASLSQLSDYSEVVVEVKTWASEKIQSWSSSCPGVYGDKWVRAGQWDGDDVKNDWAKDSDGNYGRSHYALCYRLRYWKDVKKESYPLVAVDIKVYTTDGNREKEGYVKLGRWDTHMDFHSNYAFGDGRHTNNWMFLYVRMKNIPIPTTTTTKPPVEFRDSYCLWREVDDGTGHRHESSYTVSYTESEETAQEEDHWDSFSKDFGAMYTVGASGAASIVVADISTYHELSLSGALSFASGSSVVESVSRSITDQKSYTKKIGVPEAVVTKDWVLWAWDVYRDATVGDGANLLTTSTIFQWGECRSEYPNCEPKSCARTLWEPEIKACYTCTEKSKKIIKDTYTPKRCFPGCANRYNARTDAYCDDWWYEESSCLRCTGSALTACAWKCCEMCAITEGGTEDEMCTRRQNTRYVSIDYGSNYRTVEVSAEECRDRCKSLEGCTGSSWWENGGCHVSSSTELEEQEGVTSYVCTMASSAQEEKSVGRNVFAEFVDEVSIVNDNTLIMSLALIGFFYTIFYAYGFLTKAAKYSEISSEQEL